MTIKIKFINSKNKKMKKFLVLILLIPAISIAQVNKNNVVFKDGVEMNIGDKFISNCKSRFFFQFGFYIFLF